MQTARYAKFARSLAKKIICSEANSQHNLTGAIEHGHVCKGQAARDEPGDHRDVVGQKPFVG